MSKPWLTKISDDEYEVNDTNLRLIRVNIGGAAVEIDKLYGPLSAELVRVRLDHNTAEWVVERQRVDSLEDVWEEKARWYCQESYEDAQAT